MLSQMIPVSLLIVILIVNCNSQYSNSMTSESQSCSLNVQNEQSVKICYKIQKVNGQIVTNQICTTINNQRTICRDST